MKKLKVVQIGVAHDHADVTFDTIKRLPELFQIAGLVPFDNFAENFLKRDIYSNAKLLTLPEVLEMNDIDAVFVETEENSATEVTKMFAQKGIHVHLDKPGSQDKKSFSEMIEIFKKTKAELQMGYMYRFNPIVKETLSEVQNGVFGKVFSVEAQMSVRHSDEKREWLQRFTGGMMFFLGCHLIDLVMQIKGVPDEVISLNSSTGLGGVKTEDYGFAILKYKDGVSFVKTCAVEVNGFERRQLVVCGEKKTVEIKPIEKYYPNSSEMHTLCNQTEQKKGLNPWVDCSEVIDSGAYDRYMPMLEEFYDIIVGKKKNPYSLEYEESLFKTVLRACGM